MFEKIKNLFKKKEEYSYYQYLTDKLIAEHEPEYLKQKQQEEDEKYYREYCRNRRDEEFEKYYDFINDIHRCIVEHPNFFLEPTEEQKEGLKVKYEEYLNRKSYKIRFLFILLL